MRKLKTMGRPIIICSLFLCAGLLAVAAYGENSDKPAAKQKSTQKSSSQERLGIKLQELVDKAGLSHEQKNTLRPLLEKQSRAADAIAQNSSLTEAQRRQQMQLLRQETQAKIAKILTPDQMKKLAAAKPGAEAKTAGLIGPGVFDKLNLSAQQKAALKPVMEKQQKAAQAINTDNSLTTKQKQQKLEELRKSMTAEIRKYLTAEQQAKLKDLQGKQQSNNSGGKSNKK